MPNPRRLERALVRAIRAGAALVLLTPLIVTPATVYPFVVGKALYSRAAIEVVVGLYAVLAALRPAYAPPRRSRLLLALAAGLAAALAAAVLGVSPRRSLWSDYESMQGVVDAAHWFAFTVVIAATFRTAREWRALLNVNLGVGSAIALLAAASSLAVDLPFFGSLPEYRYPRIATVFGNPLYLGAYMLVNAVVAGGFLARSLAAAGGGARFRWGRLWWGAAAALHLWAFTLAGSLGALAGLIAAGGFLGAAYLLVTRARAARIAGAAAAALAAAAAAGLALPLLAGGGLPERAIDSSLNPLLQRIAGLSSFSTSVQARLAAWQAGLAGFAARPLLGWGPDNFAVVLGRYAAAAGDSTIAYVGYAHSKIVEEAATKGLAGLATYLAVWAAALAVIARAGRRADPGEQALVLFTGAALVGAGAQIQTLFDHSASSLQYALLFGFVIHLEIREIRRRAARRPAGPPVPAGNGRRRPWRRHAGAGTRAALALGVLALAGAGLAANRAIYSAAVALKDSYAAEHYPAAVERAIAAFPPLANLPRRLWFLSLANHWQELHARDPAAAQEILARADVEASAAVAAEPENWLIQQALALMYRAAASTEPEYRAKAERFFRQSLELAPHRDRFAAPQVDPYGAPRQLRVRRHGPGSYTLTWRDPPGYRGKFEVQERVGDAQRTAVVDGTWLPLSGMRPGTYFYRVRACGSGNRCGRWASWPPVHVPAGGG